MIESEYAAIDSARLSLNKDNLSLDAYFIPFFTPAGTFTVIFLLCS